MNRQEQKLQRYSRIVCLLHRNKEPLNKYQMWKELRAEGVESEPTFLDAIRQLEESGMIQVVKTDDKARGGKPSRYYDLTLDGVMFLLYLVKVRGPEQLGYGKRFTVSKLASKYCRLLPQFLGQWDKFEKMNVADIVENSLLDTAVLSMDPFVRAGRRESGDLASKILDRFFHFASRALLTDSQWQRWQNALKQDPDLRKLAIAHLEEKRGKYANWIQRIDEFLKDLEPLSHPTG